MLCRGIILLGHILLITQMHQKTRRSLVGYTVSGQGFLTKDQKHVKWSMPSNFFFNQTR
jgi:hypothetical protein